MVADGHSLIRKGFTGDYVVISNYGSVVGTWAFTLSIMEE